MSSRSHGVAKEEEIEIKSVGIVSPIFIQTCPPFFQKSMTSYFSEARQRPDDSFFVIPIGKVLPEEDENTLRQANVESTDTDPNRLKA
jgi:hypothetical protein